MYMYMCILLSLTTKFDTSKESTRLSVLASHMQKYDLSVLIYNSNCNMVMAVASVTLCNISCIFGLIPE